MSFYGGIGDIFYQWEYLGVFDFILPFLLIFALVFGILSSTRFMGDNKGVYLIISVVIGLMSLRYQYFLTDFLNEIFPRIGIGLAVMLALMIFVGLFIAKDETRYWGYGLSAIGAVIAIIIIYQSFDRLGYYVGSFGSDSVGFIILGVLLIGVIVAVAASGGGKGSLDDKKKRQALGEAIFGPWRK